MPTETVTIAFVNQPSEGKRFGSIKSEAGDYYSVKPQELALFKKGGTYEIQYGFDKTGKYRNFERIVGASPANVSVAKNGHTQSVEMFAMGSIGRSLQGTGTFPDEDTLFEWINAARSAWTRAFSVKKPDNDLNDEIPF